VTRLDVAFAVEDEAWAEALPDAEEVCRRAALAALGAVETDDLGEWLELSVVLADDETVRRLNRDWRGKDSATNVLSFPGLDDEFEPAPEGAPLLLGDVILAYGTCAAESQRDEVPFAHHLSHLVVHGVLHLLGFDHETPEDAEEMEALEVEILAGLGIDNPYLGDLV
jgi:probable rRNA maturation factor